MIMVFSLWTLNNLLSILILLSQFIIEVAVDMLNLPHIYFSFIHVVGVMQKCVGVSFVCISCYAIVHFLVILDRAAV